MAASAAMPATDVSALKQRSLVPTLILVGLVVAVMSSLGAPLIPSISAASHVSLSSGEWLLTITLLTGALATPIMGRLADGPHQRRVILGALVIVLIGLVMAATSSSFPGARRRPGPAGSRSRSDARHDGGGAPRVAAREGGRHHRHPVRDGRRRRRPRVSDHRSARRDFRLSRVFLVRGGGRGRRLGPRARRAAGQFDGGRVETVRHRRRRAALRLARRLHRGAQRGRDVGLEFGPRHRAARPLVRLRRQPGRGTSCAAAIRWSTSGKRVTGWC